MVNSGGRHARQALVLLLGFLAGVMTAWGQVDTARESHPVIRLSGSSDLEGQTSNRQGVGQETPQHLARWRINPTVILFDVPLNLRLLLSTEQNSRRQRINSFRVGFSLDSRALWRVLRERVRDWLNRPENSETMATVRGLDSLTIRAVDSMMHDAMGRAEKITRSADTTLPIVAQTLATIRASRRIAASINDERDSILAAGDSALRQSARLTTVTSSAQPGGADEVTMATDALEGTGFIKGFERLFHNFTRFGVGVNYPNYTPTTLDGIPVTGVDFEFSPHSRSFYAALAIGKSQTSIQTGDTVLAYRRTIYAGRVGYGRRRGGHIHVTALYAADDVGSLDSAYRRFLTPQENVVVGIDMMLPVIPQIFQIDAELNGSVLTVDRQAPALNAGDVPTVVTEVVEPKLGAHGDWTLSLGSTLSIPPARLRIQGRYKRIGAGYRTLGAPRIRTDYERIEARADGRVWRNRIGWGLSARTERDNLLAWKRATTRTTTLGIVSSLTYPGYPALTFSVTPVFQNNDAQDTALRIDNTIMVLAATSSHSFSLGSVVNAMSLNLSSQSTRTLERDFNLGSNAITLADAVILPVPASFAASITYSWPLNALSEVMSRRIGVDVSGTYVHEGVWRTTLGTAITREVGRNARVTLYGRTRFDAWTFGDVELSAEKTLYKEDGNGSLDYDEIVLRAGMAGRW